MDRLNEYIDILKNNILTESKRDDLLLPYLEILNNRGDKCTLSQLKGFLLKKFSNEFGIHAVSESSNYYLAGVTRYYFEGLITTNKRLNILYPKFRDKPIQEICEQLDKLITYLRNSYIDSVGTKFEQPEDFGNLPLDKLLKKYNKKINPQVKDKEENTENQNIDINGGSVGDYTYKIIYDYEEAQQYSKYTQPGAWCITYGQQHYNAYIKRLKIHYIFFFKNGFENIPRKIGQGFTKRKPHDEYGNSMIAVLQSNNNPRTVYITSRWNHGYGETSGIEADHAYTEEEFLNVIGADSSILEQCYNQWQEGVKTLKKDTKSINSKKRQEKLDALRKLKYIQMRLNEGARVEDVFKYSAEDNFIHNISAIEGDCSNLNKGLFYVYVYPSENTRYATIMDRRNLLFDKFLIECQTFYDTPNKIKFNDSIFAFYSNLKNYIMIYNRKTRSFVDSNGVIKFKHWEISGLNRSKCEQRYLMVAKSGNEICVLDTIKGKMLKAPNGATTFESIIPMYQRGYFEDTNTDYSNHIRLFTIDDSKYVKFIYDSSANLYFVFDTQTNTFLNLPKELSSEGCIIDKRQNGLENYNLIKFERLYNVDDGNGDDNTENVYRIYNVSDNSWLSINGENEFKVMNLHLNCILEYVPSSDYNYNLKTDWKDDNSIYYYNLLHEKHVMLNGKQLIGKRTMPDNEKGKWLCVTSKSPIECTKFWQVILYNPEHDIFYQDSDGNFPTQIYGSNIDYNLSKQGYCATYTKDDTGDKKYLLPTAEKYISELNQVKENIKKNFNLMLEKLKRLV